MIRVLGDPLLLRGRTEADEEKIGTRFANLCENFFIFKRGLRLVKIAVVRAADD